MLKNYKQGVISILVPTRNRPKNVINLINSAKNTADNPSKIEFVFYVDCDDKSFPQLEEWDTIKVIHGPRMWLSVIQNVLYANACGEILMYAADDIEFCTKSWDSIILQEFEKIDDKILLVFGNDLGSHGSSIAIHGFLHRKWVETIGTFAAPFRLSLTDLWHTENAKKLNRICYLPDLIIKHIHYRQGEKSADFDSTYQNVYLQSSAWRPKVTYRKLERERRIDRILLAEAMTVNPKKEIRYFLGEVISGLSKKFNLTEVEVRRLKSSSNIKILLILIKKSLKKRGV